LTAEFTPPDTLFQRGLSGYLESIRTPFQRPHSEVVMSTMNQPEVALTVTPVAAAEVRKFMDAEGVTADKGGLRVSVQPGGCSGFKYGLLIEDASAEDDLVLDQGSFKVFVDPFSAQYLSGVTIDYVTSMQGSGFTFKNPNSTGGCGCGSSFSA
jgi:iron-sulfur cluster assembly protein